jgi:hypothetical protein
MKKKFRKTPHFKKNYGKNVRLGLNMVYGMPTSFMGIGGSCGTGSCSGGGNMTRRRSMSSRFGRTRSRKYRGG